MSTYNIPVTEELLKTLNTGEAGNYNIKTKFVPVDEISMYMLKIITNSETQTQEEYRKLMKDLFNMEITEGTEEETAEFKKNHPITGE